MDRTQFPKKLKALFTPSRYKVLYGGRGGAKSWGVARALLILGSTKTLRILCCREVQDSIKDSVHKLLSDQIQALGLGGHYDVLKTEIRGRNGTEFIFAGLSTQTEESIKSFEGIDICWTEEAQSITKNSWTILIPTIRKDGSEIWITFNPELDTDETYVRFVTSPPPDTILIEINFPDNPWFPDVLEKERLHCKATMPDEYDNIWEGKPRTAAAGAIYAKEVQALVKDGRFCRVPYDPHLKVHTIWDMGWNDSMAIVIVQRTHLDVRVLDYIEEDHKTLDWYCAQLQAMPYNWAHDWLPHDGFSGDYKTGKSAYDLLRAFGRNPKNKINDRPPIPALDVEQGIRAARMLFGKLIINNAKPGPVRLLECLKRYRRHIPTKTGEPGSPVHDGFSHGADTVRHTALIVDQLTNDPIAPPRPKVPTYRAVDSGLGALG